MTAVWIICTLSGFAWSEPTPAGEFPGAAWETQSPAAAGLDQKQLDNVAAYVGGRGCIVRHGRMVYTWGDVTKRGDVASAAKPVYAHLLFKAIEDGRIPELDEKIVHYEPRLANLNAAAGFKDREITWRHLANQISCYGAAEQPGQAYDYNDSQMALFWDLLFLKAYGAEHLTVDEKVLRPLLAAPLACEDEPTLLAFGRNNRPGRLAMSPRDFARFGLLYLRGGRWGDRPLLSESFVRQAITSPLSNEIPRTSGKPAEMLPGQRSIGGGGNQTDHLGSYSFLWWTNGVDRDGRRHWPDAPQDVFAALGHGGKRACIVVPSLDLVVSWNDTKIDGREMENEALKQLARAVIP